MNAASGPGLEDAVDAVLGEGCAGGRGYPDPNPVGQTVERLAWSVTDPVTSLPKSALAML